MLHPAAVAAPLRLRADDLRAPVSVGAARGPEHRVAALTLAALLFAGGLMGLLTLFVDGVLRDGAARWIYGVAMVLCMLGAVPMAVR